MRLTTAPNAFRLPALLLVGIFFVGMIVVDRSGSERSIPTVRVRSVVDGPTVPRADAVSVAWYCAEGTASEDGRADETVLIANLSTEPLAATITVMRGADRDPVIETRQVGALAQERIDVSDLTEAEEPGVVVELLGGPAIVEHELQSDAGVAVGPCAREPSSDWFFAAGTTERGAQEWLTLFNPFGEDAIVNVSFLTASGFDAPGATQGLAVSRRSRLSVPVHEHVQREDVVAIAVHARVGRVVAERTLIFDGTEGREGLAVSAGVTGAAQRWRLPIGIASAGVTESVSIANFATESAEVDVVAALEGEISLAPESVEVPARSVVRVDLSDRIGEGTIYSVDVRVTRGSGVVVEALSTWAAPSPVIDVATTMGVTTTAGKWAFGVGRVDDDNDGFLIAVNVSGRPLTVQLYAYTAGDPNSPRSAPARAIAPGERAYFAMSEVGVRPGQVLVVAADGPIVVGRGMTGGGGISFSTGVPDLSA